VALRGGDVSDSTLHSVVDQFANDLGHTPNLREGVLEGFQLLREHDATIVVATEGSKARIESTLAFHDLSFYVKSCIEAPKTPQLYRRLAKATPRSQSWMIGDQIDRDVAPAAAAGFRTIYFPGPFLPSWHPKDTTSASAIVKTYRDGVSIATREEDQRISLGLPAA
jgi:putative hydrolase of the HAD superfamily